ncbi:hypothetical protein LMG19089_04924 [Ralstonia edaphis]|uniref:hypothetical protein n=1 Tax=Ralstonia edaphi TaxID=3058599 RepID=UPI0028F5B56B|nr:hypothetical protein [Ralstonia sp. LMG 6871]CAJ0709241.1 hypothetical protein LMG19089_04924 [Ralstonia sp. LMG 6871]
MSMPDALATVPSPLHAAAGRFVTCALAHFNLPACGRVVALPGAHDVPCGTVLQVAGHAAAGDQVAVSPVPPSRESRPGAFGQALEARGAHSFFQWRCTGSAENPWKSALGRTKSLILEAMPPTSCPLFSTGCGGFSTGRVSAARPAAASFSLSKSLKEKKKEQGERQAGRAQEHPRVENVIPRVRTSAYFLIHGFHRSEMANLWKSVEEKVREIKGLCLRERESTGPHIALRVVPSRGSKGGRS